MATNKIATRVDTAAAWTSANPTLELGELGFESDTGNWKRGDGSTTWTSLGYATGLAAVGTVSQSGGTPTGAVIQQGENSNGEFVRFADGTQICYAYDLTVTMEADRRFDWQLPASFGTAGARFAIANPAGTASGPYGNWSDWSDSISNTSEVRFYYEGSYASGTTARLNLLAIGRCF